MVSIMEIMQLCRLCLVKEQVNIPIFEEQDDVRQICLKITSCLPVKITKEDKLPKKICDGCLYKLELLYQFYNTTANAEKQLLTWIEQINMDANEKNLENLAAQSTPPTVKQEKLEPVESTNENPDMSAEAQNYMLDQETFQPDFTFKESQGSTADAVDAAENSDEPLAKRPRRGRPRQATKPIPPESLDSSDNDNDNDDAGDSMLEMTVTKTEEESESEGEENVDDPEPTKFEAVGEDTEQPGPSGLGKGGADGPIKQEEALRSSPTSDGNVQCPICAVTVKEISLYQHQRSVHADTCFPFSCDNCGKHFRTELTLSKHKTSPCKTKCFQCSLCSEIFPRLQYLCAHEKTVHKIVMSKLPYACNLCGKEFMSSYAMRAHQIKMHEIKIACEICGKSCSTQEAVERHKKLWHEGAAVCKCDICDRSFTCSSRLEKHKKKIHESNADKSPMCDICKRRFRTEENFKEHMSVVHSESYPLYKCDRCDKTFKTAGSLKSHEDFYHQGVTCAICGKHFRSKDGYRSHMQTHEPGQSKEFICSVCGRILANSSTLYRHMRIHDPNRDCCVCEVCGKSFSSSQGLIKHRHKHTGEKPFVCDACGKGFSAKRYLVEHILIHTKEKPHKCEVCGKCFSQKTSLRIHNRYHTGERPYQCDICQKKFPSKGLLSTHSKVHGVAL